MTRRFARLWIYLLFAFIGAAEMAHGQTGNPWLDSLDNAKGTIVGDMAPRFAPAEQPSGGTPVDQADPSEVAGSSGEPGAVNPADPDTAGYIREWIDTAEPPPNVTEGANFRYTYRGNMVGTTADGGIITSPHETGAFDAVFLWQNRRQLDSVNHCTMEEFVLARMAQKPVGHCSGRYTAPPPFQLADYTGRPVEQARQALIAKQLKVQVQQGAPAPSGALENTVAAQIPGSGAQVQPGRSVTLTIYGDYAVPDDDREKIEQAVSNCQFDDAAKLIEAIDTDKARRPFSQRYNEAFAQEERTKTLFVEADEFYRACDYEEARNRLEEAAANTRCERYRAKISQSLERTTEAQQREQKTKDLFAEADRLFKSCNFEEAQQALSKAGQNSRCERYWTRISEAGTKLEAAIQREATTRRLFGEADQLFRQKDFDAALAKLNDARANTQCERYISKIKEAIAKAEDSIGQPAIASGEEIPPSRGEVSPGGGVPLTGDASYFVGLWALSPQACTGATPPSREADQATPGTIGEAIEQGIEEAMEAVVMSAIFKFDANGVFSLSGPEHEAQVVGSWRIQDDVLITHVDDEDNRARIVEKRADRFVFHDPSSGDKITMYRCATASDTQSDTADEGEDRGEQFNRSTNNVCADPSIPSDGGLTGYNRIYGGGGSSLPMKGDYACTGGGTYWQVTGSAITQYRCDPDFTNCAQEKVIPVIRTETKDGNQIYWTSDSDWWVRSH